MPSISVNGFEQHQPCDLASTTLQTHFARNAACIALLAAVDHLLLRPFVEKRAQKARDRELARWFLVHSFANVLVVAASVGSCLAVLLDPVHAMDACAHPDTSFFGSGSHWPLTLINSVHVYHMVGGFKLSAADYFHHLLFIPTLGFPGQYYVNVMYTSVQIRNLTHLDLVRMGGRVRVPEWNYPLLPTPLHLSQPLLPISLPLIPPRLPRAPPRLTRSITPFPFLFYFKRAGILLYYPYERGPVSFCIGAGRSCQLAGLLCHIRAVFLCCYERGSALVFFCVYELGDDDKLTPPVSFCIGVGRPGQLASFLHQRAARRRRLLHAGPP